MSEEKTLKKKKSFKIKDEHCNKLKSLLNTSNNTVKEVPADWRNVSMGGEKLTLKKGQALTPEELELFDSEAREFWLTPA